MSEDTIASNALARFGETPRFAIGDAVRVRPGVTDPDFADIPLSGWAGRISDLDPAVQPPLYLVRWTVATLAAMPVAYRVRCDREEMDSEECWLAEADLEPDQGGPLAIVQPTLRCPLPLDLKRPDDRVRAIFGLTTDDPLPPVDETSLQRFYDHFSQKLILPTGVQSEVSDLPRLLVLQRLLPVEEADESEGLLVEVAYGDEIEEVPLADLTLLAKSAVALDLEAYTEWINDQEATAHLSPFTDNFFSRRMVLPFRLEMLLARILLACILGGALVGTILATIESAALAAQFGGALLGVFGGLLGFKGGGLLRRFGAGSRGVLVGTCVGFLVGAFLGATAGVVLMAYPGAIPGAVAGTILGQLLAAFGVRRPRTGRLTLLGMYIGAMVYGFMLETQQAISGCSRGAGLGIGLFVTGYMLARVLLWWLRSRDRQ